MNKKWNVSFARLAAIALLGGLTSITSASLRSEELPHITVNVFPGGFNWPSFVALDKGFFERNGIRVTLQFTPNSVAQMTGLAEGKFDIAITAVDNIVAYVEGQGEAPIGPQPDFFAFMGGDSGFLNLVVAPYVKSFRDLNGQTLSVDARTTGYAFVLFEMLARNGLHEGDYSIEKVGGTVQRWNALRDKKPYQGNVGATRRSWAMENKTVVIAFIRAYVQTIDWLYDKSNREEAVRILQENVPEMSPGLAGQSYAELLDPQGGFSPTGRVDLEGLRTVLALRSRYAEPPRTLTDPLKYYDPSYYDLAMRTSGSRATSRGHSLPQKASGTSTKTHP